MTSRSAPAGSGPGATAPGRCTNCGARLQPTDPWCGLCHTPIPKPRPESAVSPAPATTHPPVDHPGLLDGRRLTGGEVPPERLAELLDRLAADEKGPGVEERLGILARFHGRAGGLLLALVLGLILLAGGMLALFLLGTMV